MSPRRLLVLALVLASGAFLVGGVSAGSSARTVDDSLCRSHAPIPARALTSGRAVRGCSLVGRTVYAGRFSAVVPPDGMGVAGDGYGTHGEVAGLRVVNNGGTVRAWVPAAAAPTTTAARRSPPPCKDRTFHLEGHHWVKGYRYHVKLSKAPKRFNKHKLIKQIKAGNANMRLGRNSCGKAHLRTPAAHYLGHTRVQPDVHPGSTGVRCGHYNTRNVVGFGNLPGNLLGWTCYWWIGNGTMNAGDMLLDTGKRLTTNLPRHCTNRWDFEGTVTHEFGHVYGMGHTGPGHANLTMQHEAKPCSTFARSLGKGDWLGMKKMYGKR